MLRLFRGTCLAVRAMHEYRPTSARSAVRSNPSRPNPSQAAGEEDEDTRFPQPEGDSEGGYSYDNQSVPLMSKQRGMNDVVFDGGDEDSELPQHDGPPMDVIPYAHRDLKPGCVSIASSTLLSASF